ncbi:hypothetical protein BSKO_11464 [Bryopsis sp. KO-2023]|nr:hypothetical protein BSKO_11464 [Bryopsis sp. KO-2023]
MSKGPSLVWYRRDLRVWDHSGLRAACDKGGPVFPFYAWRGEEERIGGASRVWLNQSLQGLDASLRARGSRLFFFKGPAVKVVTELLDELKPEALFFHECPEPYQRSIDEEICMLAKQRGVHVRVFHGETLAPSDAYRNGRTGAPYRVYTPFYKANFTGFMPEPHLPAPTRIPGPPSGQEAYGESIVDLGICPTHPWTKKIESSWTPGEAGARKLFGTWASNGVRKYADTRNFLYKGASSQLSPHLAFGEISPREIWNILRGTAGAEPFLRQICWREFARMLLVEFPHTVSRPLSAQWEDFEWVEDEELLKKWQKGLTGYPIVDAPMRELWATGWISNRTRMIVGSFLVKDLRISWLKGAEWFADTLVDADLANNILGWQWVGGCGADAAPYFRVFNPELQSKKFDSNGDYIRKWLPELAKMPVKYIHTPSEAPKMVLKSAGVELGVNYPRPLVNHYEARKVALQYYEKIKKKD